ncbi:hypothetical protein BJ165DRAFT_1408225 [Panaeolus papilionaceus]|nr:hypothetical protein BJ165DRAFT_1408225 [Panaeolus papilionaceus]
MSSKSPKSLMTFEDVEQTLGRVGAAFHEGLHADNFNNTAKACLPDLIQLQALLKAIDSQAVEVSPKVMDLLNRSWIWDIAYTVLGAHGDPQITTPQLDHWREQSRAAYVERREIGAPVGTQDPGLQPEASTSKAAGTGPQKTTVERVATGSLLQSDRGNADRSTSVGATMCSRCMDMGFECSRKARRPRRLRTSRGLSAHTAEVENVRPPLNTVPAPSEPTAITGLNITSKALHSESQARSNQSHSASDHGDTKGISSPVNKPKSESESSMLAAQSSLDVQTTTMSNFLDKINQLVSVAESAHGHMEPRFAPHPHTTMAAVTPSASKPDSQNLGLSSPIQLSPSPGSVQKSTVTILFEFQINSYLDF